VDNLSCGLFTFFLYNSAMGYSLCGIPVLFSAAMLSADGLQTTGPGLPRVLAAANATQQEIESGLPDVKGVLSNIKGMVDKVHVVPGSIDEDDKARAQRHRAETHPLVVEKQPFDTYLVRLRTDVPGDVVIKVNRKWAPWGADHFKDLVDYGFYSSPAAFFRVVPGFVVQFGISGNPDENAKWASPIDDDPVAMPNYKGTITYATSGPNSRNTQVFINMDNNAKKLDALGFAPFGNVISGMDILEKVYNPTPNDQLGLNQTKYKLKGNNWLVKECPHANHITQVIIEWNDDSTGVIGNATHASSPA